jgi:N-acyl amino acid synthase of PEP-CTERM/exosortase system
MGCAAEAIGSAREVGLFAGSFKKLFQVQLANTTALRRDAFRLRYRVYCEERQFERSECFPDHLEKDEFDDSSVHAIVRHRDTGIVVGAVRLILRSTAEPAGLLPVENVCGALFDQGQLSRFPAFRDCVAEVSRFAVSKTAVTEVVERMQVDSPWYNGGSNTLRGSPLLSVVSGLIAALFQMSSMHGVAHWYALMEPALARRLNRLGLRFTKIGPLVNHHGTRQPMLANLDELRQSIAVQNPLLDELIKAGDDFLQTRGHTAMSGDAVDWQQWARRHMPSNSSMVSVEWLKHGVLSAR